MVKVVNQLNNESVIHFHGQHEADNFFVDSAAGVTQVRKVSRRH